MASPTGGVKPMSISTRLIRERERLAGMTDEERAWRKQWLKDQILSPDEPKYVPEYWNQRVNPIRRFYRFPLDQMYKALTPTMGESKAYAVRFFTGKFLMIGAGILAGAYYFKYNQNDWTRKGGWRVLTSRKQIVPGDPNFPKLTERTKPSDYAERNFGSSPI